MLKFYFCLLISFKNLKLENFEITKFNQNYYFKILILSTNLLQNFKITKFNQNRYFLLF